MGVLDPGVVLDELLEFGHTVDHMDTLASVETSWFEDPDILASEVTHGHDKSTGSIGELLDCHLACIRVACLFALLADETETVLCMELAVETVTHSLQLLL